MEGTFCSISLTPINREHNKKVVRILHSLLEIPQSVPFRKPVPHKALKLDDYLNVVKKPIDLNLIRRQNNEGHYKNVEQILDDIQLCWNNCKIYNAVDSQIYKEAQFLEGEFLKMVKDSFSSIFPADFQQLIQNKQIKQKTNNIMIDESQQKPIIHQNVTKSIKKNVQKQPPIHQAKEVNIQQVHHQEDSVQQSKQQSQNISQPQQPELPPPDPIIVNLKLTPSKQQIAKISQSMSQANKNTFDQILQILYTYEKELLTFHGNNQMQIPITKIHISTYMRICKILKIEEGNWLIE